MKQILLISLLLCIGFTFTFAQKAKTSDEVTDEQWSTLFAALENENWKNAFELSDKYLKILKNDDEAKSIANLRYIYLYSAAGNVAEGTMSYEDLEKNIKSIVGKKIALPFRQILTNCRGELNFICPSDKKDKKKKEAMITATNKAGTTIFAFEYVELKEKFAFAKHKEKFAAIIGIADSIAPNPNKSKLIIMRIYISDGEVQMRDK